MRAVSQLAQKGRLSPNTRDLAADVLISCVKRAGTRRHPGVLIKEKPDSSRDGRTAMQHHSISSATAGTVSLAFSPTLPLPLTSLIGREQESATICSFLRQRNECLLTLTGTGGVGKTRLALHVATHLLGDFSNGVSFVPLAPIRDAQFVLSTIAKV